MALLPGRSLRLSSGPLTAGSGLRSLLDIWVYLRKYGDELNWGYIEKELETLGLKEFEEENRSLALSLFQGEPLNTQQKEMLDFILRSGTFGTMENEVQQQVERLGGGIRGKLRFAKERILLTEKGIESAYPFFYRHKVLIPFLYPYRVWRAFFRSRKKTVAVVGGGDTACEDALYLSGLAKKVYLIVRKPFLRASKVMQDRVMAAENIEILFEHNTLGLFGENGVEGAHLVKRKGEADEQLVDIQVDGFFLAIGHKPNTDIFKEWLDTDEVGYLKKIDGTPRTKLPGIFVAGDCADPVYRQAISAAGTGCQAAIEAERFLLEN